MGDIAEAFEQFKAQGAAAEPEQPAEQVETPEPEASPAAAEKPRFSLDDVILDDPRLPPSLRGKPASALFEERTEHVNKLKEVGFDKNRFKAERDAFEQTLRLIAEKKAQREEEPPPPALRASEQLRKRGTDPSVIYNDADAYTDSLAEVAEERILPKFNTKIKELEDRLAERDTKDRNAAIRSAFLEARPQHVPPEEWQTDYAEMVSSIVLANDLPLDDPSSYKWAADRIEEKIAARAGKFAPPSSPPAAPAPPVGATKTAPVVPNTANRSRVSNHEKSAYNSVAAIFKKATGIDVDADAILSDLANDPKYRGIFS